MKKRTIKLVSVFILSLIGFTSCEIGKGTAQVTPEAEDFLNFYEKNYQSITTESLKQSGKTRSAVTP